MAIVKILSRHSPSYASLITYILRYIGNESKRDKQQFYTNNVRSNNIDEIVKEFIANEAFRRQHRSDQVSIFHEIISFSSEENKEVITDAMIDDLAHEYMRLRGETGVMLGGVHKDKNHIHLHFCVSALHYRTGKSFGLNKRQLLGLKQSFQEYHKRKHPELTMSMPEHGKGERYKSHAQWHAKQREKIINTVTSCFAQATTQQEFLALLRDRELHHYERNGKPTGIEYEGMKFRFSRLLPENEYGSLPNDSRQEDIALTEIQAVRERQRERDERDLDIEDRER